MPISADPPYYGFCPCKKIRYRITDTPLAIHCCHCTDCQRETGSAFALNVIIETEKMELEPGCPELVSHVVPSYSGDGQTIFRCPNCLFVVRSYYGHPYVTMIRAGTLDPELTRQVKPDVSIYERSKLPFVTVTTGIPRFEAYYANTEVWSVDALERKKLFLPKVHAWIKEHDQLNVDQVPSAQ